MLKISPSCESKKVCAVIKQKYSIPYGLSFGATGSFSSGFDSRLMHSLSGYYLNERKLALFSLTDCWFFNLMFGGNFR